MSIDNGASAPTREGVDAAGYPAGLVPPSRRGRSDRPIGEVIVDLGFASQEEIDRAVATARLRGKMTGQVLIEAGAIHQEQLARALAERFGVDYVDLSMFEVDMNTVALISPDLAKRYGAVPVGNLPDGTLVLAMADPTNVLTLDELAMITGRRIRPAAAAPADIDSLIGRVSQFRDEVAEFEEPEPEPGLVVGDSADDAPIIKLVHSIIGEAIERGASDIHCKPDSDEMQVLFRVDGVLTPAATVSRGMSASVVSRIKVMASLDIAERRAPQDGRLAVMLDGRRIDVRVVTLPLVKGEGVVMRVLDTGAVVRDLDSLGMQPYDRERFETAVGKQHGAVLVTGPTGSGKSTTVYSALAILNDGQRSILTIEDPVESTIAGIDQMQIHPKAGVTFVNGLRSMLRADPDVIMVGEIRDRETAEISIQAALTGHLVLSTLHTRTAASTITRLIDMRIEPFMIAAAVDCVVGQRLVRRLCEHCRQPAKLHEATLAEYGLEGATLFEPAGCIRCSWTGYRGRVGVYEVMAMSEEIRTLVVERRGADEIRAAAVADGMRTMREDGIDKVKQGATTLAEIARVSSSL